MTGEVSITPVPNGPLLVKELKKLQGADGKSQEAESVALCRCGKSKNKPFCDGQHWHVKFKDAGVVKD